MSLGYTGILTRRSPLLYSPHIISAVELPGVLFLPPKNYIQHSNNNNMYIPSVRVNFLFLYKPITLSFLEIYTKI